MLSLRTTTRLSVSTQTKTEKIKDSILFTRLRPAVQLYGLCHCASLEAGEQAGRRYVEVCICGLTGTSQSLMVDGPPRNTTEGEGVKRRRHRERRKRIGRKKEDEGQETRKGWLRRSHMGLPEIANDGQRLPAQTQAPGSEKGTSGKREKGRGAGYHHFN